MRYRAALLALLLVSTPTCKKTETVTLCDHCFGDFIGPDGSAPFDIQIKADGDWISFETYERGEDDTLLSIADGISLSLRVFLNSGSPMGAERFEQIGVTNSRTTDVEIEGMRLANLPAPVTKLDCQGLACTWLSNGYQSWSSSAILNAEKIPASADATVRIPLGQNTDMISFDPTLSWWYGALESPYGLSVHVQTSARTWKSRIVLAQAEVGFRFPLAVVQGITGDGVVLQPSGEARFEDVDVAWSLGGVALEGYPLFRPASKPPFVPIGWNSWNTLFDKVTEADILANAKYIKDNLPELGINNIQVDDGWEKSWGDWEANAKFPDGMDGAARKIKELGFIPGIWFAPFMVDETSPVAKEHPDWFLRGFDGELTKYGVLNFGGGTTKLILDITHPEANAWMLSQIRKIVGWGYRFLKLDFLFGGAIEGKRFDTTKTALETYRQAMQQIAEAAGPEAYILACGAPILPSVGLAHAIRIGPDLAFFNVLYNWSFIKAEVLNLATRHFLWPAIAVDPDATLVRDVPENEARFLLAAALMAPGIFAIGDNLPALPPERLDLYKRAAKLTALLYADHNQGAFSIPNLFDYPAQIIPKTNFEVHIVPGSFPIAPVWIRRTENATVVAFLNGEDVPQQIQVYPSAQGIKGRYQVEEIFSGEKSTVSGTLTADLSPHEGRLYLFSSP